MHVEKQSAEVQDMIRARLVRGQTCSSAPEVRLEAELAWSTGDGASGDVFVTAVTCIAAFLCFLAFFLAALLICNTCSQFKSGHWVKFSCFLHMGAGILKLLLVHKSNLWFSTICGHERSSCHRQLTSACVLNA